MRFRAWDKELKFFADTTVYFIGLDGSAWFNNCGDGVDNLYDQSEKLVLMEWTGLKDINGKDIYEGDCVRFEIHDGATVVWNEDTACFEFEANKHYCEPHINQKCEIVGNIYENPELIATT